jgi:hypothetical protein
VLDHEILYIEQLARASVADMSKLPMGSPAKKSRLEEDGYMTPPATPLPAVPAFGASGTAGASLQSAAIAVGAASASAASASSHSAASHSATVTIDAAAERVPPMPREPTLADILSAINAGNKSMNDKFESVRVAHIQLENKFDSHVASVDQKLAEVHQVQNDVVKRLEALEIRGKESLFPPVIACPSAASGRSAASGSAAHSRSSSAQPPRHTLPEPGRDLVFEKDPWAGGGGRPPPLARAPPRSADFVPSRGWIRGWSPYKKDWGDRRSASRVDCQAYLDKLKPLLPARLAQHVTFVEPTHRNFQLTVVFSPELPRNGIFEVVEIVRNSGLKIPSEGVEYSTYLATEQEPWKIERSRQTRAAFAALRKTANHLSSRFTEDLKIGAVWYAPEGAPEVLAGRFAVQCCKWQWSPAVLEQLGVNVTVLDSNLESELF